MIIDGDKTLTGNLDFDNSLWLADCQVKNAKIKVKGDLYVEKPCLFLSTSFEVSGDIVFKNEIDLEGEVSCDLLASHERFSTSRPVKADKVFVRGESNFTELRAREIVLYGSCFAKAIEASVVRIDGDLISDYLAAQAVSVERGSLLVKDLRVERAKADIIGNYSHDRLDESKFQFKWARPMAEGAEPRTPSVEDMIRNGLLVLRHHTENVPAVAPFYDRIQKIKVCTDFTPLYADLYEVLKAHYSLLYPAFQQF
ncbi:MAG: hypothetical protein MN733_34255, partial [Nitrososphaera sp.]|nr:hypothetical protein [Nitrososphaera sp.]